MITPTFTRASRILAKSAALVAVGLGLLACSIQSTESRRIDPTAGKVNMAKVVFDPTVPGKGRVVTSAKGIGAVFMASSMSSTNTLTAINATADYSSLFQKDFSDRFPALAEKYGLTVSPTAAAELKVQIVDSTTHCVTRCVTRVILNADLFDASGKALWHFSTQPGQSSIFAKIDDSLFDAAAHELLETMKKDGIIGG